jgi:GNAT superfamily N-acetyltransferase
MTGAAALRAYAATDRAAVLSVFRSNAPRYFAPDEEAALLQTLDEPDGPHWVLVEGREAVGYGGFEIGETYSRVTLCWGMVRADLHGRGLGRRLLAWRAHEALRLAPPGTAHLVVDTTPAVAGFYLKAGFERVSDWPMGYRAGFDMVVLRMAFGSPAMATLAAQA